ncbi:MAG: FHA domain-containing protein [Ruminococcus sp.]|nr:FHA domain-containing protein [Ruminococcus sp.]
MICKVKPYEGNEPYIFFSYSHKNEDIVYPIIEAMSAKGYRIWYDEGINPGADWPEVIAKHLINSSICMIAVTPSSVMSHNCRNEMTMAIDESKYIIALQMDNFPISPGIRLQLASTQIIKAFEYSENEMYNKIFTTERLNSCKGDAQVDISETKENHSADITETVDKHSKNETDNKICIVEHSESGNSESRIDNAEAEENLHESLTEMAKSKWVKLEKRMRSFIGKSKNHETNQAIVEESDAKEEVERKAIEEEKRQKEEAERKAIEEEKRQKEEAERKAIEEEKRQKEEAERKAIEEEKRQKEEAERKAVEEKSDEYIEDGKTLIMFDEEDEEDEGHTRMETTGTNPVLIRLKTREIFKGNYPMTSIGRKKYVCDLYFNVDTISSHHADIIIHDGKNYFVDHNSSNGTYVNNKKLKKNESVTIDGFAEIKLSRSEKFIIAFDDYAEWITGNMCLISLVSLKTHERKYIFENEMIFGRSIPWHSETMKDMRIGRKHAIFHIIDGICYCEDISQNGTFRVTGDSEEKLGKNNLVPLKDGDKLRFGKEYFIFNYYELEEGILE